MSTLLLNSSEVTSLLDIDEIITGVEGAYKSLNSGLCVQPDILNLTEPGTHTGFDFKLGLDMGAGYYSMKSSSGGYPNNPEKGLPSGLNMVYLYAQETSELVCVMEGNNIRNLRTAAAAAVSIKYLAKKDASKYFVYGAGRIGRAALEMTMRLRPIKDVYVFGYMEGEVEKYIEDMSAKFPELNFHPVATPEEGAREADIIVSVTLARKGPVINKEWLKPGCHVVAIGTDGPSKQELCTNMFAGTKVVNDCIEYASKNGDTYHAIDEGVITVDDIYAEIGEIALGKKAGRENDEEITVFDTVGMAVQDLGMALTIYKKALAQGKGTSINFYE